MPNTDEAVRPQTSAEIRRRLRSAGTDDGDIDDIAGVALDLAQLDYGHAKREAYDRHVQALIDDVHAYAKPDADAGEAHEALVQIIARRYGYGGGEEAFDDLRAANLMRVIDSRNGLPVAVGILYIHVARARGWHAAGVDFPGRFLVRLDVSGERRVFDPFDDGRVLNTPDLRDLLKSFAGAEAELEPRHYREASNREVLVRLMNNLKVRLLRREGFEDALRTIRDILLIDPDNAALWREAGMVHHKLDQVKDAIMALEEFIRLDSGSESRYSTSILLQQLRTKLN